MKKIDSVSVLLIGAWLVTVVASVSGIVFAWRSI